MVSAVAHLALLLTQVVSCAALAQWSVKRTGSIVRKHANSAKVLEVGHRGLVAELDAPSKVGENHHTTIDKDGVMVHTKLMRHASSQERDEPLGSHHDVQGVSPPSGTAEDSLAATWAAMKLANIEAQKSAPPLDKSFLSKEVGSSKDWLVFTSVGDAGNVRTWTSGGSPLFDVFAAYYGEQGEEHLSRIRKYTTLAWSSKASKFQNLFYAMTSPNTKHLFERYSAVLACDDDIDLDVPKVHVLFQALKKHDMQMLGPSFDPSGERAWLSGTHVSNSFLRFGAFIEVTCPVFKMSALKDFMFTVYNPVLAGWGVDLLYSCYFNFPVNPHRWGVLDAVTVLNAPTHKNGAHDASNLGDQSAAYHAYFNKYKLQLDKLKCGSMSSREGQWHHMNYSCGRVLMHKSDLGQAGEYVSEGCGV